MLSRLLAARIAQQLATLTASRRRRPSYTPRATPVAFHVAGM
jgi:hypothetical protein